MNVPNFGPGTIPACCATGAGRSRAALNALSGGRLVLGVGVGWARQEFEALGVPFERRGALTDDYLDTLRAAWADPGYRTAPVPLWIGGNSGAALRRAVRLGEPWHPLRFTPGWFRSALERLKALADEAGRPVPSLAPRIVLRLTDSPVTGPSRLAGEGTIAQVVAELRALGAETVVLDPCGGDPEDVAAAGRVAGAGDGPRPRGGLMSDEKYLRRPIELAAEARESGTSPFGSLLVGPDGSTLAEDRNSTISDRDIAAHPEQELARWAAREPAPETAAGTTMDTSCQPCGMCTGALERSGLGRVVFALSGEQLESLKELTAPVVAKPVPQEGPFLFDEARVPMDGYYR